MTSKRSPTEPAGRRGERPKPGAADTDAPNPLIDGQLELAVRISFTVRVDRLFASDIGGTVSQRYLGHQPTDAEKDDSQAGKPVEASIGKRH